MNKQVEICDTLDELGKLCPAGYVTALQLGFHVPDFMFQTFPRSWIETYTDESLAMRDPILLWGMTKQGVIKWSELPQSPESDVMERAAEHGLLFGIVEGIETGDNRSMCSAGRSDREFTEEESAEISTLFHKLHDLTAELDDLTDETCAFLRDKSIDVTRAGSQ